jgi:hypothetical protein
VRPRPLWAILENSVLSPIHTEPSLEQSPSPIVIVLETERRPRFSRFSIHFTIQIDECEAYECEASPSLGNSREFSTKSNPYGAFSGAVPQPHCNSIGDRAAATFLTLLNILHDTDR